LLVVGGRSNNWPWTWRTGWSDGWVDTRVDLVVFADGRGLVAAVRVEVEDGLKLDGEVAGGVWERGEELC
jgi:hypothetical protein